MNILDGIAERSQLWVSGNTIFSLSFQPVSPTVGIGCACWYLQARRVHPCWLQWRSGTGL